MAEKFLIDGDAVRNLAQLLNETNLSEVEYQMGTQRIRVSRQSGGQVVAMQTAAAPVQQAAPVVQAAPIAAPETAPTPQAAAGETVKSPMVGTAYLKPEPGAEPYVKVGDTVKAGQTLLIVEAMKVMNPIKSPRDGKVVEVIVSDGSPVEYGAPLLVLA